MEDKPSILNQPSITNVILSSEVDSQRLIVTCDFDGKESVLYVDKGLFNEILEYGS